MNVDAPPSAIIIPHTSALAVLNPLQESAAISNTLFACPRHTTSTVSPGKIVWESVIGAKFAKFRAFSPSRNNHTSLTGTITEPVLVILTSTTVVLATTESAPFAPA